MTYFQGQKGRAVVVRAADSVGALNTAKLPT